MQVMSQTSLYSKSSMRTSLYDLIEAISEELPPEVAQKWISEKLNVYPMIAHGQAAHQIARVAEEENADLIILGTHGRKGLDHIIFGSVAEKVVRTSQLPVLTIQAQK